MRKTITVSVLAVAVGLTGCSSTSNTGQSSSTAGQRATTAGALGAVAGGIAGAAIGPGGWARAIRGAALGGLISAGATYIWSSDIQKQGDDMVAATEGTGVAVARTEDNLMQVRMPENMTFAIENSQPDSELRRILDKVATSLNAYPDKQVFIAGHTDNTGAQSLNNQLSRDRAMHVRDYLISRGVAPERVHVVAVGSRFPVADNSTAEGRAKNRRVEIYVGERQPS